MSETDDTSSRLGTVAILGLGLLGGSLGLAIRKRNLAARIVGWSHRGETRLRALHAGAVDETHPEPSDAVRDADLVVCCTPVGTMAGLFDAIRGSVRPEAVVTDVGSTKKTIVAAGQVAFDGRARFVGSHPMAGGERHGIGAARDDLYDGALCLLTPTELTDAAAVATAEAFWQSLGMRTTRLSPDAHDRYLADVSHLPHLLAAALVAMQEERALAVAGPGFRDATRIAAGDAALWRDIFMDNRDATIRAVDRLMGGLQAYRTALQSGDARKIESLLATAAEKRRGLT